GNLIGTTVYSTYSEGDWRFSTNFGAHHGTMEMIRTIDLSDKNLSSGKTTLAGSSGEARIGYELMGSKTMSVIPSLALGNRNSRSKAYSERATADYLALAVPSYAQNSNYLALGFDVRMLQNWGSTMIMPRLSASYEQANRNTKQYGEIGFVADKNLLLTTNSSGRQNIGTTNFAVGVDMLSSDEGSFALRGDYKASFNREGNVQNLTIGTKMGF
ncbi:MAG: autotransporter outer membrane beta-barrel domain-containing protein, partial [Alphaproteobacteria bacterium]|nr:autotransporter outer membrane beta-barrel domain-containing protein [Alphaproteobacteria bacterium]